MKSAERLPRDPRLFRTPLPEQAGHHGRGAATEEREGELTAWITAAVITLSSHHPVHRIHPLWHPGATWWRQSYCIRVRESGNNYRTNTGNGYFGAYQFLMSTYRSVGGRHRPDLDPPREQSYRAWRVWLRDGRSWREWGTAGLCGLR